jgi:hypothetical protein
VNKRVKRKKKKRIKPCVVGEIGPSFLININKEAACCPGGLEVGLLKNFVLFLFLRSGPFGWKDEIPVGA